MICQKGAGSGTAAVLPPTGKCGAFPRIRLVSCASLPHPDGDVVSTIPGPSGKPLVGGQHRDDDKYKYLGGVVSPVDGCMYCIPSDADRILRVDPSTASCSYVGRDLSDIAKGQSRGQNKWQNGFAGLTAASTRFL